MKSFNNFMAAIIAISIASCTASTVDNGGGGNVTTVSQTSCQTADCYDFSNAVTRNSDGEALDTDGTTILTYGTDSWNGTSSLEGGALRLLDSDQFTTEATLDHTLTTPAVSGDISGTNASSLSAPQEDFGIGGNIVYVENPEGYTAADLADYDYVRTYVITDNMGTTDTSDDSILYQGYHGIPTAIASIPTTGSASYSGLWSGQATIGTDTPSSIGGNVNVSVDFAAADNPVSLNFTLSDASVTTVSRDFSDTGATVSAPLLLGISFDANIAGSVFVAGSNAAVTTGTFATSYSIVPDADGMDIDDYAGGHFFGLDSSGNPDELAGGFGFTRNVGYRLSSGTDAPETYDINILANFIAD